MRAAAGMGFHTKIHTNGLLLDQADMDALCQIQPFEIRISLDGGSARTNDYIRGSGTFRRTLQVLKDLVGLGLPVTVATTWSTANHSEVTQVMRICADLGVQRHHSYLLVPKGRAEGLSNLILSSQEVDALTATIAESQPEGHSLAISRHHIPLECKQGRTIAFMEVKQNGELLLYEDSRAPWGQGIHEVSNVLADSFEATLDSVAERFQDRFIDCERCDYYASPYCIELDHYCVADVDLVPFSNSSVMPRSAAV
jgi:MoaA/NifB/PqqE/SkfB family radical SAM enzyme